MCFELIADPKRFLDDLKAATARVEEIARRIAEAECPPDPHPQTRQTYGPPRSVLFRSTTRRRFMPRR